MGGALSFDYKSNEHINERKKTFVYNVFFYFFYLFVFFLFFYFFYLFVFSLLFGFYYKGVSLCLYKGVSLCLYKGVSLCLYKGFIQGLYKGVSLCLYKGFIQRFYTKVLYRLCHYAYASVVFLFLDFFSAAGFFGLGFSFSM